MEQSTTPLSVSDQSNPADNGNENQSNSLSFDEYFKALLRSVQRAWDNYFLWLALALPAVVIFLSFGLLIYLNLFGATFFVPLFFLFLSLALFVFILFYVYPVLFGGIIKIINEIQNTSLASSYSIEGIFEKGKKDWKRVLKFSFLLLLIGSLIALVFGWIPLVSNIVGLVWGAFFSLVLVRGVLAQEDYFFDLVKRIINLIKSKTVDFLKLVLVQAITSVVVFLVLGVFFGLVFLINGAHFFNGFGNGFGGQGFFGMPGFGGMSGGWQGLGVIMLIVAALASLLQSFFAVVFFDLSVWWLTKMSGLKSEQMEEKENQPQEEFVAASGANQNPEPTFSETKEEKNETQEKTASEGQF